MSKEAMKLALEALIAAIETAKTDVTHYAAIDFDICADAIQKGNAALEALAKQEQGEPVTADEKLARMKSELAYMRGQQEQGEPVAWLIEVDEVSIATTGKDYAKGFKDAKPLYTTPQQRTWVGLTIGEIQDLIQFKEYSPYVLAENIEAKLKEKNT
jgi:hypothetical protein